MAPSTATIEIIGDPEIDLLELVDHDASWLHVFEAHRSAIAEALGHRVGRIEHIGSTAVPGLAAKPIVDLVVTVEDPDDDAGFLPYLQAAGYSLRVVEPGHRMLRPDDRRVHVHLYAHGDPAVDTLVAFRDRLRVDETDRAAYAEAKRSLIAQGWASMDDYAQAKTPIVSDILSRVQV
jgi:GrpB-like predicted nucleotidyltransferase (UPF0157 family)